MCFLEKTNESLELAKVLYAQRCELEWIEGFFWWLVAGASHLWIGLSGWGWLPCLGTRTDIKVCCLRCFINQGIFLIERSSGGAEIWVEIQALETCLLYSLSRSCGFLQLQALYKDSSAQYNCE